MVIAYLDTSAAMKLVVDERESDALSDEIESRRDRRLVASWLLHTELHCALGRLAIPIFADTVSGVLGRVDLVDLTRGDLIAAGTYAPLRSQDAIHLAVALRLGVDEFVTYDRELGDAASRAGIRIVAPTA